ncbi:MAG: response regulator [Ardenticatenaceae bacterium]|nr:response regulator [Ardenticatenaceae bacterium]
MPQPSSEPTALIIEDDPDLVHIFARALELSGYQTQTTVDGEGAVALLAEMVPDIVVLDLHLPGISGKEILQSLRADGRFQKTRIILATADYQTADDLRDDADLVLLKPISFKQLRDLSARLRAPLS